MHDDNCICFNVILDLAKISCLLYLVFVISLREHPAPHLLLVHESVLVEVAVLGKLLLPLLPLTLQGSFAKHCLHVLRQIDTSVIIQVVILETVRIV